VITGVEVPLEAAVVLCAVCAAAGQWAGHVRANRRLDPRRDPLRGLWQPAVLAEAVDLAARRDALRAGSRAVLHGRIDQLATARGGWDRQTREELSAHVAAVMRNGLRRDDHLALEPEEHAGARFTIIVPGADERAAVRIADRLRRKLGQLGLAHLGASGPLTASFGVAAARHGESGAGLEGRARRALDAAMAQGTGHVVPASEIEEVILLPAPAAPPPAASAA